jgi:hypothetical protein
LSISLSFIFQQILACISHNVKVVYDVSGVAIKKLRSSFSNPRNVAEKKPIKGVARLGFFRARAALAAKRIQSCYMPFAALTTISMIYNNYLLQPFSNILLPQLQPPCAKDGARRGIKLNTPKTMLIAVCPTTFLQ